MTGRESYTPEARAKYWAESVAHDTGLGLASEAASNAASVLLGLLRDLVIQREYSAGQERKIEELRSLLDLERQSAIGQVAEITRLRNLGKNVERELEEATLARGRLRLWLEFIHMNSNDAKEFTAEALIGNAVPEGFEV